MNQEGISLISTIVNLLLSISKLIIGFWVNSIALIADGIHSGLDIFSSFVTFLGIRVSKKPVDKKHPYGFYRAEGLAGFIVTLVLFISAVGIVLEGIKRFKGAELTTFSFWAIGVMIISTLLNEIMARLKFYYGRRYDSLALVADAEHSRADVISSAGVLVGLFLVKYFNLADAVIAILIGLYIIWESFNLGKEVTDSLLDVSNEDIERRIRKICQAHNIEVSDIKTRKIGSANFAELKINIDPELKVNEVGKIIDTLKERLLRNISGLKYIIISIEPYKAKRKIILSDFGHQICSSEGLEEVGPKKIGERTIIPIDGEKVSDTLGGSKYLIVDIKDGKILQKKIVKNPFFDSDSPHGARFIKAVSADRILTKCIGANARENLESFNVRVETIPKDKSLDDILKSLT